MTSYMSCTTSLVFNMLPEIKRGLISSLSITSIIKLTIFRVLFAMRSSSKSVMLRAIFPMDEARTLSSLATITGSCEVAVELER